MARSPQLSEIAEQMSEGPMGKILNNKQENMEKMVAMVLLAYVLGLLMGEELRDLVYGPAPRDGGFASAEDPLRGKIRA